MTEWFVQWMIFTAEHKGIQNCLILTVTDKYSSFSVSLFVAWEWLLGQSFTSRNKQLLCFSSPQTIIAWIPWHHLKKWEKGKKYWADAQYRSHRSTDSSGHWKYFWLKLTHHLISMLWKRGEWDCMSAKNA